MARTEAQVFAYSYVRFSSPEQAKGDSLRRQIELRDHWLQRNSVTLDTSLSLRDEGISGFSGKHRENPDRHALATFLKFVQAKKIPRGSYLIVESLDRLTREHIRPALTLLLNLIDNGVRIVQLLPVEAIYDDKVEPMTLMMAIMELSRGHSESRMKSERVGRAWIAKRERAATSGEVLTCASPSWIRVINQKYSLDAESSAVIRRIFRLTIDGHGIGTITKRLNAEGVKPIGRAKYWARSYIAKILTNKAVIGEYQPHSSAGGTKRKPVGEPIPHFFPAVIPEQVWYAARTASQLRRQKPGRLAKGTINLFSGLLHDARDGGSMILTNKGKKSVGRQLTPYRAHQGVSARPAISFPFETFEYGILSQLKELLPADVLPRKDDDSDRVLQLTGRLAAVEGRLTKLKAALLIHDDINSLVETARTLEDERTELSQALDSARKEAASPLRNAWGDCHSLIDLLDSAPDDTDLRIRLRAAIRRIISGIWCLFVSRGLKRFAIVQVWFEGHMNHRDYLMVRIPRHGGAIGVRNASVNVQSMRYEGPVDLRKRENVVVVEQYLQRLEFA